MFREFAFMASTRDHAFKPRKHPVQARSEATVSALFEASIQVLLAVGYRKLTTTRVAERAGVSIGTLYQYFPNRQALINSVIERYLDEISSSIGRDCQSLNGCSLDEMSTGLVDAFIAAKWRRLDVARAMHEPLVDVGGAELVMAAATRVAGLVAGLLASCRDAAFRDVLSLALFIVTACSSLLQAAVTDHTDSVQRGVLHDHMRAMVLGYLREMRHRT
ncbi:MAG: TetR/AcrR family transcriptional regulator [Roseiarcus sp.]